MLGKQMGWLAEAAFEGACLELCEPSRPQLPGRKPDELLARAKAARSAPSEDAKVRRQVVLIVLLAASGRCRVALIKARSTQLAQYPPCPCLLPGLSGVILLLVSHLLASDCLLLCFWQAKVIATSETRGG